MTAHRAPAALGPSQIITALSRLDGWKLHGDGAEVSIEKTYAFGNFLQTMAFANAVAYLAEQQDHHPDLLVRWGSCSVRYRTHSAQGITAADFTAAAAVDALQQSGKAG